MRSTEYSTPLHRLENKQPSNVLRLPSHCLANLTQRGVAGKPGPQQMAMRLAKVAKATAKVRAAAIRCSAPATYSKKKLKSCNLACKKQFGQFSLE
jgi:hypothetical protein